MGMNVVKMTTFELGPVGYLIVDVLILLVLIVVWKRQQNRGSRSFDDAR